jgi:hypothetical protein
VFTKRDINNKSPTMNTGRKVLNIQGARHNNVITDRLKLISSAFAIAGGIILASNTSISGYGFIFLATSSSLLLLSSIILRDKIMILYAASLFCCVDCVGIYRWVLS